MNPRQVLPERDLPGLRSLRSGPSMLSEGLRQYVTQLNSQIGRSPRRTLHKKIVSRAAVEVSHVPETHRPVC